MKLPLTNNKRVVIAGGGFAGIEIAKALKDKPYQVVLLDKNNYFTFQPLLYQVAMSGLEANSIVYPFRRLFRDASNIHFRMMEIEEIDPANKEIVTSAGRLHYDYLIVATGSRPRFFGQDPSQLLPLKSVPNALSIRNYLLTQFEKAHAFNKSQKNNGYLNVVVVGGGPTGVELAGALGEMKRQIIPKDYPEVDANAMKIYLLEGLDRLLPSMSEEASAAAEADIRELGVQVITNALVDEYDGEQVYFNDEVINTKNLIWTAGVQGNAIEGTNGALVEKSNCIRVDEYNRVPGYKNIFAAGDVAKMILPDYPEGHPMLAPVAVQQGRHLAKNLLRIQQKKEPVPFRYTHKGAMATIGRNRAVADLPNFTLTGFWAWLIWMFVHLFSMIGFRNKIITVINWTYNYFTYDRSLRFIIKTEDRKKTDAYVNAVQN